MGHRFYLYGLALVLFVSAGFAGVTARADENKEYLVKAAFIFNFVKFVEWPAEKAIGKQPGIDICVVGDSNLIKTSSVFKEASSAKLGISLVSEPNIRNVPAHCHILFISKSEDDKLADIVGFLKGKPVLTVGDSASFAERGVMIGFVDVDGKIKLEVNKHAAEAAGLRVDAQLLEIAVKVIDR